MMQIYFYYVEEQQHNAFSDDEAEQRSKKYAFRLSALLHVLPIKCFVCVCTFVF